MDSAVDILYYAPGGGMGHATRAAAILRRLRARGITRLLAVVTTPLILPLAHEALPVHRLPDPTPATLRAEVPALLRQLNPRVLVVDVFPRGIVHELTEVLPTLACRKVLVHRHLRAPYAAPDAWVNYDRILLAEDTASDPCARACGPILLRDAAELLPRAAARACLRVGTEERVVLGVSSDAVWTDDLFRVLTKCLHRAAPQAALRLASPEGSADAARRVDHYPLLELLHGVDVVVGAGGYHLFHEARACGVAAIFLPRSRAYDDQHWRVADARVADGPEALEAHLRDTLASDAHREEAHYHNGADIAAREIAALLG